MLQWGRDRMAAERRPSAGRQSATGCFNGAATGWPRNAAGSRIPPSASPASMGPRPDGRGTLAGADYYRLELVPASMGPRPDGRGTLPA